MLARGVGRDQADDGDSDVGAEVQAPALGRQHQLEQSFNFEAFSK